MQLGRGFIAVGLSICAALGWTGNGEGQTSRNPSAGSAARPSLTKVADQRARFAGTYRYAGDAQEQEARLAAIDRGVEGMSVFIRSTARSRISATTQILGSYSFSFEAGKIRVI